LTELLNGVNRRFDGVDRRFNGVDAQLRELRKLTGATAQNIGSLVEVVASSEARGFRVVACTLGELASAFALPDPASNQLLDDTVSKL